jgi:hypothetical protein
VTRPWHKKKVTTFPYQNRGLTIKVKGPIKEI